MSDVFISYKRENLAAVGRLVEALRAEGIGVWWDQDIPPNAAWEATIERELAAAKLVIVAWSPSAVASDNVKAEARWARGQGRLLQVFVEACEPPLFFGERQGVDLKGWSGAASHAAFGPVLDAVRNGLERSPGPEPDQAAQTDALAPAGAAPPLPSKPSIAVLPFNNHSGDSGQDYFADGIVEEITTALARFSSLFVIASGSSLSYRETARNPKQIAHELGVRYLLEGSVRRSGERVRITVQLVDAVDAAQVWAERFDGVLEDVFALQDTIANAVAGQIQPSIQAAEIRRANARPTQDLGAYDLYLRGIHLTHAYDRQSLLEAVGLFDQAIARDPNYALALAWAAVAHSRISVLGWSDDGHKSVRLGLDLCRRALRGGEDDPEVLAAVAEATWDLGGDVADADALIERALILNPGASYSWLGSGWLKTMTGRPELGLQHFEKASRLDPRSPYAPINKLGRGISLVALRRFEEAIPLLKEAVQLRPEQNGGAMALTVAYAHLGRLSEARAALRRVQPPAIRAIFNVFPDPALREVVRSGLALAGADV